MADVTDSVKSPSSLEIKQSPDESQNDSTVLFPKKRRTYENRRSVSESTSSDSSKTSPSKSKLSPVSKLGPSSPDSDTSQSTNASPNQNTSRYGRTRKPKITEDFYNIEDIFGPYERITSSPSRVVKKKSAPKLELSPVKNPESKTLDLDSVLSINIPEDSFEVSKVMKIVVPGGSPVEFSPKSPSYFSKPVKTYENRKKRTVENRVVESFGLPDYPPEFIHLNGTNEDFEAGRTLKTVTDQKVPAKKPCDESLTENPRFFSEDFSRISDSSYQIFNESPGKRTRSKLPKEAEEFARNSLRSQISSSSDEISNGPDLKGPKTLNPSKKCGPGAENYQKVISAPISEEKCPSGAEIPGKSTPDPKLGRKSNYGSTSEKKFAVSGTCKKRRSNSAGSEGRICPKGKFAPESKLGRKFGCDVISNKNLTISGTCEKRRSSSADSEGRIYPKRKFAPEQKLGRYSGYGSASEKSLAVSGTYKKRRSNSADSEGRIYPKRKFAPEQKLRRNSGYGSASEKSLVVSGTYKKRRSNSADSGGRILPKRKSGCDINSEGKFNVSGTDSANSAKSRERTSSVVSKRKSFLTDSCISGADSAKSGASTSTIDPIRKSITEFDCKSSTSSDTERTSGGRTTFDVDSKRKTTSADLDSKSSANSDSERSSGGTSGRKTTSGVDSKSETSSADLNCKSNISSGSSDTEKISVGKTTSGVDSRRKTSRGDLDSKSHADSDSERSSGGNSRRRMTSSVDSRRKSASSTNSGSKSIASAPNSDCSDFETKSFSKLDSKRKSTSVAVKDSESKSDVNSWEKPTAVDSKKESSAADSESTKSSFHSSDSEPREKSKSSDFFKKAGTKFDPVTKSAFEDSEKKSRGSVSDLEMKNVASRQVFGKKSASGSKSRKNSVSSADSDLESSSGGRRETRFTISGTSDRFKAGIKEKFNSDAGLKDKFISSEPKKRKSTSGRKSRRNSASSADSDLEPNSGGRRETRSSTSCTDPESRSTFRPGAKGASISSTGLKEKSTSETGPKEKSVSEVGLKDKSMSSPMELDRKSTSGSKSRRNSGSSANFDIQPISGGKPGTRSNTSDADSKRGSTFKTGAKEASNSRTGFKEKSTPETCTKKKSTYGGRPAAESSNFNAGSERKTPAADSDKKSAITVPDSEDSDDESISLLSRRLDLRQKDSKSSSHKSKHQKIKSKIIPGKVKMKHKSLVHSKFISGIGKVKRLLRSSVVNHGVRSIAKMKPKINNNKVQSVEDLSEGEARHYSENSESGQYQPNVGSLAWSRVGSYPFWPSIITNEPDTNRFYKNAVMGRRLVKYYHVNFFGDNGRRSWVFSTHVFPFQRRSDLEIMAQSVSKSSKPKDPRHLSAFIINPNKLKKWETAVTEAESLTEYSPEVRIQKFIEMVQPKKKDKEKDKDKKRPLSSLLSPKSDTMHKRAKLDQKFSVSKKYRKKLLARTSQRLAGKISPKSGEKNDKTPGEKSEKFEKPEEEDFSISARVLRMHRSKRSDPDLKTYIQISDDSCSESEAKEAKSSEKEARDTPSPVPSISQAARQKRNNLFRGVTKERVCQICGKGKKVFRCKGTCYGLFHVECEQKIRARVMGRMSIDSVDKSVSTLSEDSDLEDPSSKRRNSSNTDTSDGKNSSSNLLKPLMEAVKCKEEDFSQEEESYEEYSAKNGGKTAKISEEIMADDPKFTEGKRRCFQGSKSSSAEGKVKNSPEGDSVSKDSGKFVVEEARTGKIAVKGRKGAEKDSKFKQESAEEKKKSGNDAKSSEESAVYTQNLTTDAAKISGRLTKEGNILEESDQKSSEKNTLSTEENRRNLASVKSTKISEDTAPYAEEQKLVVDAEKISGRLTNGRNILEDTEMSKDTSIYTEEQKLAVGAEQNRRLIEGRNILEESHEIFSEENSPNKRNFSVIKDTEICKDTEKNTEQKQLTVETDKISEKSPKERNIPEDTDQNSSEKNTVSLDENQRNLASVKDTKTSKDTEKNSEQQKLLPESNKISGKGTNVRNILEENDPTSSEENSPKLDERKRNFAAVKEEKNHDEEILSEKKLTIDETKNGPETEKIQKVVSDTTAPKKLTASENKTGEMSKIDPENSGIAVGNTECDEKNKQSTKMTQQGTKNSGIAVDSSCEEKSGVNENSETVKEEKNTENDSPEEEDRKLIAEENKNNQTATKLKEDTYLPEPSSNKNPQDETRKIASLILDEIFSAAVSKLNSLKLLDIIKADDPSIQEDSSERKSDTKSAEFSCSKFPQSSELDLLESMQEQPSSGFVQGVVKSPERIERQKMSVSSLNLFSGSEHEASKPAETLKFEEIRQNVGSSFFSETQIEASESVGSLKFTDTRQNVGTSSSFSPENEVETSESLQQSETHQKLKEIHKNFGPSSNFASKSQGDASKFLEDSEATETHQKLSEASQNLASSSSLFPGNEPEATKSTESSKATTEIHQILRSADSSSTESSKLVETHQDFPQVSKSTEFSKPTGEIHQVLASSADFSPKSELETSESSKLVETHQDFPPSGNEPKASKSTESAKPTSEIHQIFTSSADFPPRSEPKSLEVTESSELVETLQDSPPSSNFSSNSKLEASRSLSPSELTKVHQNLPSSSSLSSGNEPNTSKSTKSSELPAIWKTSSCLSTPSSDSIPSSSSVSSKTDPEASKSSKSSESSEARKFSSLVSIPASDSVPSSSRVFSKIDPEASKSTKSSEPSQTRKTSSSLSTPSSDSVPSSSRVSSKIDTEASKSSKSSESSEARKFSSLVSIPASDSVPSSRVSSKIDPEASKSTKSSEPPQTRKTSSSLSTPSADSVPSSSRVSSKIDTEASKSTKSSEPPQTRKTSSSLSNPSSDSVPSSSRVSSKIDTEALKSTKSSELLEARRTSSLASIPSLDFMDIKQETIDSDLEDSVKPKSAPEIKTEEKSLSLAEQIDMKMQEVMERLIAHTKYTDSTTDEDDFEDIPGAFREKNDEFEDGPETFREKDDEDLDLQDEESPEKTLQKTTLKSSTKLSPKLSPKLESEDFLSAFSELNNVFKTADGKTKVTKRIVKHVTADGMFDVIEEDVEPKDSSFKCTYCSLGIQPPCFICNKNVAKSGDEKRHKCMTGQCGKYYHSECLKEWPQAKWRITTLDNENLSCSYHNCHTCTSDDPRGPLSRYTNEKLSKCIKCPTTYHSSNFCIPAGTEILSSYQIICPKHTNSRQEKNKKNGKAKFMQHVNAAWCFICSMGGSLICCETCPSSFHVECLKLSPPEGRYVCEECESGRMPLYDEIVWVKLGAYRWWPAQILFPNEVPENVRNIPHNRGEFVVKFFGSHDHYWVNRGRVFLFQEGDTGHASSKKSAVDGLFVKAIEEATKAHKKFQDERENRAAEAQIAMKPPSYIKIKVNKPVGNVRSADADTSNTTPCDCDPSWKSPCGPDSDCLNRILMTECSPMVCAAGSRCCNQSFEKRLYAPVEPFKTNGRGWGLKTLAPIKKGSFVIEYVGELIDEKEYRRRMKRKHEQKDENYYFLTIDKNIMIDAGPKGNVARFMNHSCSPNCETQKWTVNGDTKVGLFAIMDIPSGAELTFNYNLECIGEEKKECRCGAPNCSGFIGAKAKQEESTKKKKSLLKTKKKKSPAVTETKMYECTTCFVCGKPEAVQMCDRETCNKWYHLQCIHLEYPQDGRWLCPWHSCNNCKKRTMRCCYTCINSYCPNHSDGNIRYDKIKGFVCAQHDVKEKEAVNSSDSRQGVEEEAGKNRTAMKTRKSSIVSKDIKQEPAENSDSADSNEEDSETSKHPKPNDPKQKNKNGAKPKKPQNIHKSSNDDSVSRSEKLQSSASASGSASSSSSRSTSVVSATREDKKKPARKSLRIFKTDSDKLKDLERELTLEEVKVKTEFIQDVGSDVEPSSREEFRKDSTLPQEVVEEDPVEKAENSAAKGQKSSKSSGEDPKNFSPATRKESNKRKWRLSLRQTTLEQSGAKSEGSQDECSDDDLSLSNLKRLKLENSVVDPKLENPTADPKPKEKFADALLSHCKDEDLNPPGGSLQPKKNLQVSSKKSQPDLTKAVKRCKGSLSGSDSDSSPGSEADFVSWKGSKRPETNLRILKKPKLSAEEAPKRETRNSSKESSPFVNDVSLRLRKSTRQEAAVPKSSTTLLKEVSEVEEQTQKATLGRFFFAGSKAKDCSPMRLEIKLRRLEDEPSSSSSEEEGSKRSQISESSQENLNSSSSKSNNPVSKSTKKLQKEHRMGLRKSMRILKPGDFSANENNELNTSVLESIKNILIHGCSSSEEELKSGMLPSSGREELEEIPEVATGSVKKSAARKKFCTAEEIDSEEDFKPFHLDLTTKKKKRPQASEEESRRSSEGLKLIQKPKIGLKSPNTKEVESARKNVDFSKISAKKQAKTNKSAGESTSVEDSKSLQESRGSSKSSSSDPETEPENKPGSERREVKKVAEGAKNVNQSKIFATKKKLRLQNSSTEDRKFFQESRSSSTSSSVAEEPEEHPIKSRHEIASKQSDGSKSSATKTKKLKPSALEECSSSFTEDKHFQKSRSGSTSPSNAEEVKKRQTKAVGESARNLDSDKYSSAKKNNLRPYTSREGSTSSTKDSRHFQKSTSGNISPLNPEELLKDADKSRQEFAMMSSGLRKDSAIKKKNLRLHASTEGSSSSETVKPLQRSRSGSISSSAEELESIAETKRILESGKNFSAKKKKLRSHISSPEDLRPLDESRICSTEDGRHSKGMKSGSVSPSAAEEVKERQTNKASGELGKNLDSSKSSAVKKKLRAYISSAEDSTSLDESRSSNNSPLVAEVVEESTLVKPVKNLDADKSSAAKKRLRLRLRASAEPAERSNSSMEDGRQIQGSRSGSTSPLTAEEVESAAETSKSSESKKISLNSGKNTAVRKKLKLHISLEASSSSSKDGRHFQGSRSGSTSPSTAEEVETTAETTRSSESGRKNLEQKKNLNSVKITSVRKKLKLHTSLEASSSFSKDGRHFQTSRSVSTSPLTAEEVEAAAETSRSLESKKGSLESGKITTVRKKPKLHTSLEASSGSSKDGRHFQRSRSNSTSSSAPETEPEGQTAIAATESSEKSTPKPSEGLAEAKKRKLGFRKSLRHLRPEESTPVDPTRSSTPKEGSVDPAVATGPPAEDSSTVDLTLKPEAHEAGESVKRKRGRPRKVKPNPGRGRPRKIKLLPEASKQNVESVTELYKLKLNPEAISIPKNPYEKNHVNEVKLTANVPARHLRVVLRKQTEIDTKNDNKFLKMQNDIERDLPIRKRSKLRYEAHI